MWIIYALIGALGKTYSGFFRKKIALSVSSAMYIWIVNLMIVAVLTPFILIRREDVMGIIRNDVMILAGSVITNVLATKLNFEALKREELSYTAPLNSFVPIFTLVIASLFLREAVPSLGILGVFVIMLGAYIVSIDPLKTHWLSPIKRLTTSKGAQLSIIVALCYAINTVMTKFLTNDGYSSLVIFYLSSLLVCFLLSYIPLFKYNEFKAVAKEDKRYVFLAGFSAFASGYFHILATSSTYTSYATSIRRLDSIFSIVLGWKYLNETNIRIKLFGATIMIIGTIFLSLS